METIDKVGVSSANWHIIPSGPSTRKKLMAIDEGDEVHLKGWLVEAVSQNGQVSRSSLSRTDAGDGACEIIWVTDISVK